MFNFKKAGLLLAAICFAVSAGTAEANPIRAGFNGSTLNSNDDGSAGPISMGFTVDFFGLNFSNLFVNNNGNVTFDSALSSYTPFDLTSTGRQIIAPFFADVDTRNSANVTYGTGTVNGRSAFGVNWIDVGFYNSQSNPTNSFQLVLIERNDTGAGNFDIEFNYGDIRWETGEASGGTNGLGGNSARAGFSNGTGNAGSFFEISGSAVNGGLLDLETRSNVGFDGRFLFTARNGSVDVAEEGEIPAPMALSMMLVGLAGVGTLRRK